MGTNSPKTKWSDEINVIEAEESEKNTVSRQTKQYCTEYLDKNYIL